MPDRQLLGGLGDDQPRRSTVPVVTHYNIAPVLDIYATTQGRDLGAVAGDIKQVLKDDEKRRAQGRHRHACAANMRR